MVWLGVAPDHTPKQARGGGFGQCEVSRRVNPLYQGKHAARVLDNDLSLHRTGRVPRQARGGGFGQCEVSPRVNPMYQSKHAAAVLDNAKSHPASIPCTKASTRQWFWLMRSLTPRQSHVPRQARGGGFGQCEVSRRVNPLYQGKHAARVLDNDLSLHRTGRVPK